MGKKCIPGVFCIENMTLFIMFIVLLVLGYLYYLYLVKQPSEMMYSSPYSNPIQSNPNLYVLSSPPTLAPIATRSVDTFNNPYIPPTNMIDMGSIMPTIVAPVRAGVPVNVPTRGYDANYTQVGILTRTTGGDMILPVMGRQTSYGRSKYQYYTMSNSGNFSAKLPLSVNGKSCTSEYGCDEINTGDIVYVEGYNDTFRATIYENSSLAYIPF
jgi:hypothetical protein